MAMIDDTERREVARRLRGLHLGGGSKDLIERTLSDAIGAWRRSGMSWDFITERLADLIEPNRDSGGRAILCAHCENVSWCGCEPGDEEGGCDFEPSVTEGEPPHNLYSLYEAVLRRRPRDEYAIEDDEVEELFDALLDICNAPGNEYIQRTQPSEPKVRCVAEVKVDGERLEKLAHDAVVELTGIDRDALLAESKEAEKCAWYFALDHDEDELRDRLTEAAEDFSDMARSIREALGVKS